MKMWSDYFCKNNKPTFQDFFKERGSNLTENLVKIIEAIYDEQQYELERQNNVSGLKVKKYLNVLN